MNLNQRQIQHLYLRTGFGMPYPYIMDRVGKSAETLVDELFSQSDKFEYLKVIERKRFTYLNHSDLPKEYRATLSRDSLIYRDVLRNAWVRKLAKTDTPLRERMTLFWHGHFASRDLNPLTMEDQNNMLREKGLGNFRDLLFAISKDPCMLRYLGNTLNREKSPNENFARELMELFTLGRGHYTEQDVKNAAKAFTGWTFNSKLEFEINSYVHDDSEKTFMGVTGNLGGEDILNIILEKKQTANFITRKVYKYFVNPETIDENVISSLSDSFYKSGYDIGKLIKQIFTSPWFYDEKIIGQQIKSPIQFLTGMHNLFLIDMPDDKTLMGVQKDLGQILFAPPNVSGWPEGREWIDSSTLAYRAKLPTQLFSGMDWNNFASRFRNVEKADLPAVIAGYLLQSPINVSLLSEDLNFKASTTDLIREIAIKLTQFPDFQLC